MKAKYPVMAVVAMARNRVIGDGEKLLWHLPGDLPRVKDLTMGRPLIMGRRTFESIGKPLSGRGMIVLTRKVDWMASGVVVARSVEDAFEQAENWINSDSERQQEIIIFGGGDIYRMFLPFTDAIDLTEIDLAPAPDGMAMFPELNPDDWHEASRRDVAQNGDTPAHSFIRLERKNRH